VSIQVHRQLSRGGRDTQGYEDVITFSELRLAAILVYGKYWNDRNQIRCGEIWSCHTSIL